MFTFQETENIRDKSSGYKQFYKDKNLKENQFYDEQEVNKVNKIVEENKKSRSSVIDLSKIKFSKINKYPKEIKLFNWIMTVCLDDCNLFELDSLPINTKYLSAKNNEISLIKELPKNLTGLDLTKNNFSNEKIEFPLDLEKVVLIDNQFSSIPKFGKKIKILNMKNNIISKVDYINPSITDLNLSINSITNIEYFSENLKIVNITGNRLKEIPKIPESIIEFYCDDNNVVSIPNITKNLKKITFKNNCIKNVDFSVKEMENIELFDLRQNKDIKIKNIIFAMKLTEKKNAHQNYDSNLISETIHEDEWLLDNIYVDKVYEKPKITKIEVIEEIYLVIFDLIKEHNNQNKNLIIIDYDNLLNYITDYVEIYYIYHDLNDVFVRLAEDIKKNEEIRLLLNKLMKIDENTHLTYSDIYNYFKKALQSQGLPFNIKRLQNQENIKLSINVDDDESNNYYGNILDLVATEVEKGSKYENVYETAYSTVSYDFDEHFKVKEIYEEAIVLFEKKELNENNFSNIINKYIEIDKSGFLSYFGKSLSISLYKGIINKKKFLDILDDLVNIIDDDIEGKLLEKPEYIYNSSIDVIKIDNDKKYEKKYSYNDISVNKNKNKNKDKNKIIFKKIIKI
jgi:hypothetical protein